MSQSELAERFGLTKSQISRYEKDKTNPEPDVIFNLARFFDVSTDFLLDNSHKEQDTDFDPIAEHNRLLENYGIEDSSFFDIEKWKQMGPEELKQLESYFQFIYEQSQKKNKDD